MAESDIHAPSQHHDTSLLSCSFNQDGSCLAVGTSEGFTVHNLAPQHSVSVDRKLNGGVSVCCMLFRCNILALVGGGPNPIAAPHRVLIWDDHIPKEIGELSFRQQVINVQLRKDAISVALRDRVYVYVLADLTLRDKIYTADNPHGLLAVSTHVQDMVLACPSVTEGHVRVELYGQRKTVLIEAHESALRALALTTDGSKVATASIKGTVIRLFDVATASSLMEFRRGVERADISCLAFSWDHSWLACTSDKGTAHIFSCQPKDGSSQKSNKKNDSSLTQMIYNSVRKSVQGDTHKSVCQVRGVPHPMACSFVTEEHQMLAIAGWDADGNGVLLLAQFAVDQEPRRVGYHVVCQSGIRGESEEAQRRRRLRGWQPRIPETPEGGRLYIGERLEILEKGMQQIQFEDTDEFVSVTTLGPLTPRKETPQNEESVEVERDNAFATEGATSPGTLSGDSIQTEPLDDCESEGE